MTLHAALHAHHGPPAGEALLQFAGRFLLAVAGALALLAAVLALVVIAYLSGAEHREVQQAQSMTAGHLTAMPIAPPPEPPAVIVVDRSPPR